MRPEPKRGTRSCFIHRTLHMQSLEVFLKSILVVHLFLLRPEKNKCEIGSGIFTSGAAYIGF